jgi:hypothetical protein
VGLKHVLLGAVLASLAATADAAPRAKTRFDGIRDCERLAAVQFKRHNPAFRRFTVDRSNVTVDRYSDRVGSNFVTAVYHGRATYDAGKGPDTTRFICLQGGTEALFVYTLPD